MSVDTLSAVDVTAVTRRPPQEIPIGPIAESDWADVGSEMATSRLMAAALKQAETIARLREACELNRARAHRLIARLRQIQSNPTQIVDDGEAIDQRMSQLLERAATHAAGAKTQFVNTERAQLAAMRELSQQNAKLLLDTHFRRHFLQVTVSQGTIVLLAMFAGAGLLVAAQSTWPGDIYPAILCFALAAAWGWRYLLAVFAPLRRQSPCGKDWRASIPAPPSILCDDAGAMPLGGNSTASTDKCTVADLLAEWRTAPTKESLRF